MSKNSTGEELFANELFDTINECVEEQKLKRESDIKEIKLNMMTLEKLNAKVVDVGLYWNGHYQFACVRFTFNLSNGGGIGAEFNPRDCDYRTLIDDVFGIDSENGVYLEELKDKPCCCWLDENRRLKYISNFMDDDKMMEVN